MNLSDFIIPHHGYTKDSVPVDKLEASIKRIKEELDNTISPQVTSPDDWDRGWIEGQETFLRLAKKIIDSEMGDDLI